MVLGKPVRRWRFGRGANLPVDKAEEITPTTARSSEATQPTLQWTVLLTSSSIAKL